MRDIGERALRERDFRRHWPSIYLGPDFSPRLPHPSNVLRIERLSKEREADEETVKVEPEPSFGDPERNARCIHFDQLGLDDHGLLLSMTPYVSNTIDPLYPIVEQVPPVYQR